MPRKTFFLTLLIFVSFTAQSYNLKQISNKDGLSNSAILSICQDHDRFMWFGSCDGLNMYDGLNVSVYKPAAGQPNNLSGNLIESILQGEDHILWVAGNHGLNRINTQNNRIEYHPEFQGKYLIAQNRGNEVFAIRKNHSVEYYNKNKGNFSSIQFPGIIKEEVLCFFIDSQNVMWIFSSKGNVINASVTFNPDNMPSLKILNNFSHEQKIIYASNEKDRAYFVDEKYCLYELNTVVPQKNFIKNLQKEILENGSISDIIKDNEDFLVAFLGNGLLRLVNTPENEIKYKSERIDIFCGIFSLYKDELQDIIWIGTDGQGAYMYSRDAFSLRSVTFNDLPYRIQKPVRALFLDEESNLWIGTKDDGILKIGNYLSNGEVLSKRIEHLTTNNSELLNNAVYAFAPSRRNIIWIGSDGPGLNYYSYKENKIKKLASNNNDIRYIHSIYEESDSVLWLASAGYGMIRIKLGGSTEQPVVLSSKRMIFTKDVFSYNYFFSAYPENDSILWFGNREHGAMKLNMKKKSYEQILFRKENIEPINDILSVHKDCRGKLWFGSSSGISRLDGIYKDSIAFKNFNETEGLPNNTVHGILEDDRGRLWLSTNNGLVEFDTKNQILKTYNHNNGLNVIEFSDGAYYKDPRSGTLFFGGTNGFVTVTKDNFTEKTFTPQILFTGIRIYENEYNLSELLKKNKKGEELIRLKHDQNFFSISFIALDYINGQNNSYSYNLENFNDKWINIKNADAVTFTNLSAGEYILHVKCKKGNDEFYSSLYSIKIIILPPWYMTTGAHLLYFVLSILSLTFAVRFLIVRSRKRHEAMIEKMNQQQKEDIYESKLRFFTNITHELCTPLTLIYGPCDRIVSYPKSDPFIRKYANLILRNTEKLNSLIQELIEFRRIETGNKTCVIEQVSIPEFAGNIAESFIDLAETKNIRYHINIENPAEWNTDKSCLTKIITNLISNAFKYTPDEGDVSVEIRLAGDMLEIIVTNTGKGIKEEQIPYIFDRYTVLENFEKQSQQKGIASRNGLGLAICHNMVQLLGGSINVKSTPNVLTEFRVELPSLEISGENVLQNIDETYQIPMSNSEFIPIQQTERKLLGSRPTILIIDNDPEMLWFVSEVFADSYDVISEEDSSNVINIVAREKINLIISDMMMPSPNGIELVRLIKENPITTHIPVIILSAQHSQEKQVEAVEAGAEVYLTKPFNVTYLKTMVDRLLKREEDLKKYYNSALSAFELSQGQFIHKDDKDFYEKFLQTIDKNIFNQDISTELLARELGISPRHLYRRLGKVTDKSPSELIKEYKLAIVAKLLINTNDSIEEVMYKAGYANKGNFFKLFYAKYGTTPKNYRQQKKDEMLNPEEKNPIT